MASLRRFPRSPFFFACFTLPDGKRVQQSTKETTRKKAQQKADEWESLSKERAKARQAHKVIAGIYRAAHKEELPDATPSAFIAGWLVRKKPEIAKASYDAYEGRTRHFLIWLGSSAQGPLAEMETRRIIAYRDHLAASLSPTTTNQAIKILRVMFEDAKRDGFIAENPAKDCPLVKKIAGPSRRPFTVDQIEKVLAAADPEWRSMVLFGIYTGQRLADLARLTWERIDTVAQEISLVTAKTSRVVRIPIVQPLMSHIAGLPVGKDSKSFIHPRAAGSRMSANSTRFGDLLASIGLIETRTHAAKKDGQGRAAKRAVSELSFHSLRHTATSLMKNAGVSPAIVQDIIGHESAEISAHYTHVESAAKRTALETLPDMFRPSIPPPTN